MMGETRGMRALDTTDGYDGKGPEEGEHAETSFYEA
jgi:hypothetical protein